jgi:hypothetical protein
MSFIKIEKIDPNIINNPDIGHIYLGQDSIGLWEKDEYGNITYILSGNTYITINNLTGITYNTTGSTSSGTSGTSGFGTSGTSGKSGISGTFGTSGSSALGTSGTSGFGTSGSSGSSSTSGESGSSGTSGKDGNFFGSSGSSATSGWSGGYGASTRRWIFSGNTIPEANYFFGWSETYLNSNLGVLEYILLNKIDFDEQNLYYWLVTWDIGILKIENREDFSNFGLYKINTTPIIIGNTIKITNLMCLASNGSLIENKDYYISFISNSNYDSGTLSLNGNMQIIRGNAIYHRQVLNVDTVGDWREISNNLGFYIDYCSSITPTVWVNKHTITI